MDLPCTKDPSTKPWNISGLLNRTRFENETIQLPDIACQYYSAVNTYNRSQNWSGYAKVIGCILGLISSIASLIIFSRKPFRIVSFSYHLVINAADLLNSLMLLDDGLSYLLADTYETTPIWVCMRGYFTTCFNEICQYWVNLLIIWVAIDRCAACMWPKIFEAINTKPVAISVVFLTFALVTAVNGPDTVKSYKYRYPGSTAYTTIYSAFKYSGLYDSYDRFTSIYILVVGCVLVIATCGVIVGLVKMALRKRKLASYDGPPDRKKLKECSLCLQLCILQLCESVPLIAHEVIHFVNDQMTDSKTPDFITALPLSMNYPDAVSKINRFLSGVYLRFAVRVADVVSHCGHFYWYIIFSPKVREYVFSKPGSQVGQTTLNTQSTFALKTVKTTAISVRK